MAAGASAEAFAWNGEGAQKASTPEEIVGLFHSLPGDVAIKIHAPAANGKSEYLVESKPARKMFVGSAIKTFVLCETLRQVDSPTVVQTLQNEQLDLNASVWSPDSATFNPPNLIGKVSLRTALEAMILHSDNTGTDMCLKHTGPERASLHRLDRAQEHAHPRRDAGVIWIHARREGLQEFQLGGRAGGREFADREFSDERRGEHGEHG
jgi:hypothetical protein